MLASPMHDDFENDRTLNAGKAGADPLLRAPAPGRWVLWHGPQAQAVLELARRGGQRLQKEPALRPPEHFAPPLGPGTWWRFEAAGQRFLLREDELRGYLSCYLFNETA